MSLRSGQYVTYFGKDEALVRGPGEREIVMFYPDGEILDEHPEEDRRVRLRKTAVVAGTGKAQEVVDRLVGTFGLPPLKFPIVLPSYEPVPRTTNDSRSHLDAYLAKRKNARLSIILSDLITAAGPSSLGQKPWSHLVEFDPSTERMGWKQRGAPCAVVQAPAQFCPDLVADVLVDLWVYHSLSRWHPALSSAAGKRLSAAKVQFLVERGSTTRFGAVSSDSQYVALASSIPELYSGQDGALREYLGLWGSLLSENNLLVAPSPITSGKSVLRNNAEGLLESLRRGHIRYGQLPIERIRKSVSNLDAGSWLFVLMRRVPRNPKVARDMVPWFGKTSPRTNRYTFVRANERALVDAYGPWVSVYPFLVAEPGDVNQGGPE